MSRQLRWLRFKWACNEIIGKIIAKTGKKPHVSSGLCGCMTYGWGDLDDNGYWQYPSPKEKHTCMIGG